MVLFIFPFLGGNKSFRCSVLSQWEWFSVDQQALKSSLGSVCQRATPTGQVGPTPSKFMSKHVVSDSLADNMTSHVNIY